MKTSGPIVFSFVRDGLHRSKKDRRGVYYELQNAHPSVRMSLWVLVRFSPWGSSSDGEALVKGTHQEVRDAAQLLERRDGKAQASRFYDAKVSP